MNKKTNTKTNKVIVMIVIVMLLNFVMPNYSNAGIVTNWAKNKILNAFAELLLVIPDSLLEGLQGIFLDESSIEEDGKYSIKLSPGTIFAGKIPAFDIDFISNKEEGVGNNAPEKIHSVSVAQKIRTEISTWYNVLENVSLVALLSILVYIAIRIIISSAAF